MTSTDKSFHCPTLLHYRSTEIFWYHSFTEYADCEVESSRRFKSINYESLVEELLKTYEVIACKMQLQLNFLDSRFDIFPN
jgi:hypothetical protein